MANHLRPRPLEGSTGGDRRTQRSPDSAAEAVGELYNMQAQLTDGRIIELMKDCQCVTHNGPHWLHMDRYTRTSNLEILGQAEKLATEAKTAMDANFVHVMLNRFAEVEIIRIEEKKREMQRQGIVRLISNEATT